MKNKTSREITRIIIRHLANPNFEKFKVGLIDKGRKMVKPEYSDTHAYLVSPRVIEEFRAIAKRMRKP